MQVVQDKLVKRTGWVAPMTAICVRFATELVLHHHGCYCRRKTRQRRVRIDTSSHVDRDVANVPIRMEKRDCNLAIATGLSPTPFTKCAESSGRKNQRQNQPDKELDQEMRRHFQVSRNAFYRAVEQKSSRARHAHRWETANANCRQQSIRTADLQSRTSPDMSAVSSQAAVALKKSWKVFGGTLSKYTHDSSSISLPMTFNIYLPPQSAQSKVPV